MQCVLDTGEYPIGIKHTKVDVEALPLERHEFHGEWNFTLTQAGTPQSAHLISLRALRAFPAFSFSRFRWPASGRCK